jgi:hypothetical protein
MFTPFLWWRSYVPLAEEKNGQIKVLSQGAAAGSQTVLLKALEI